MTYQERLAFIGDWKEELCRCCMNQSSCKGEASCPQHEMALLQKLFNICTSKSAVENNELAQGEAI